MSSLAPPSTLSWFARHELRLAWRDWVALMTGGRAGRGIALGVGMLVVAVVLHLMAQALVGPWVANGIDLDKPTLVLVTGAGFLFWTVMLSQALESVTRAYYARSDLDLIFSSPASARRLFAVRAIAVALGTILLACMLASPVVNMLAINDGPGWLAAYGVLAAMGALATALALVVTAGLFRLIGPKRTRLVAQIIAGVIGAGFLIGIQVAAILGLGSLSRFSLFQSSAFVSAAPPPDSLIYLPALAALGDPLALIALVALGIGVLALVVGATSAGYSRWTIATIGIAHAPIRQRARRSFRRFDQKQALRRKEWKLLARDPWLLSQTLMQVLYLLPPALMLWLNYGQTAGVFVVVAPVLVTAAGQLAGGLAWLAVSGEDAHDLVTTAPLAARTVILAKIEAVIAVIAVILAPLLLLIAISSLEVALITAAAAGLSAGSATAIQLWFRAQARRSMFRRRQVSSRVATIAEALCSLMWAGSAALLIVQSWVAVLPVLLALIVLAVAYAMSPQMGARRPSPAGR